MGEEKYTIQISAVTSKNIIYAVEREAVNQEGKKILVLMLNGSGADALLMDNTAHLLWNNLLPLGFNKITTWNINPTQKKLTKEVQEENEAVLLELLKKEFDSILVAWGTGGNTVRRHIVGGTNRTLISVILPPRLHSPVGDRRLLAGQPHAVVALFQRQDSCF